MVVCGRGGLSGLHRGGRIFGGLSLQGQYDRFPERNIFEYSCNEEGTGAGKDVFEGGFKFAAYDSRN